MSFLLAYAAIGLVAALIAARYEYRDGAAPGDVLSAGAVGMFVAIGWPVVALVLLVGLAAKALVRSR